jgi:PIN domain nuclease of toxin-antitoxin system
LKLLVDTHAAIWWLAGDGRLSEAARTAIADAGVEAGVSVASIWEASIKRSAGRLRGPDLAAALGAAGLPFLRIDERHAKVAGELPLVHRDPFDRMLVAQASVERLSIVTGDAQIAKYGVAVIW